MVRAFDGDGRSGIGGMSAGDYLDERAFSCAIFAEDGMDFASVQIQRHPAQGPNGSEGLANVLQSEELSGVGGGFVHGANRCG